MRCGFGSALADGGGGEAFAQTTSTTTFSTTESVVFNPAVVTTTNITNNSTQIIGQIVGGSIVYDQTFPLPYLNPTVQAGQTAAIAAITTAGGPGVVIGAPVLTASSTNTVTTSTSTYSVVGAPVQTVDLETTIGPGSILIGPRTVCTGISALPGPVAPTCGPGTPTTFTVLAGTTNDNFNTNTEYTIGTATSVTNTTTIFEQYTISGYVQAIGGEHAAVISAMGDENQRFTRVMLARIVAGGGAGGIIPASDGTSGNGWANGFGWTGHGVGDSRSGAGLDGGMTAQVSEQMRLGFGISHGWVNVALDDGSGSAKAQLTELGLAASWKDNGFYAGLTGVAGFGQIDTSGLVSSASYSSTLLSAAGELGYDIASESLTLTPNLGGQWTKVNGASFTGALTSAGSSNSFGKAWVGLKAQHSEGALSLSSYTRLVAYSAEDITVPVSFSGSSVILPVTGANRDGFGVESGLSASYAVSDTVTAFAAYDLALRSGAAAHAGQLGVSLRW